MKYIVAAIFLAFAATAHAQDAEIRGVIDQQFEAFKADDVDEAFSFASPNIQRIFRTPEMFGMMVQQGYPMVWRPGDVRYLPLEDRDGQLVQRVLITDAQGAVHALEYHMIEGAEGWLIDGVFLLPAPDVAA
ncbi:DUF4864 domain-containing protein [Psychromarinibacter sp. S121]|uniref:DUF4864 domain-containing protein n=1 Tax=Psychromarinibacter sp. S121 TaxID=3415127 RepID=UPI003C7CDEB5